MKKLILLSIVLLIPVTANAYTTYKVTPIVVAGMTIQWTYEFYFTKPPSKEHGSVFVEEYACKVPMSRITGNPLVPVPIDCVNSQAEADVAAGKKAGVFEWNCRHSKECDLDKIGARHRKQKPGVQ